MFLVLTFNSKILPQDGSYISPGLQVWYLKHCNKIEDSNYVSLSKDYLSPFAPDTNCYIYDNIYGKYIKEGFPFLEEQLNECIFLFKEIRKASFLKPKKYKYYSIFSCYLFQACHLFQKNRNYSYAIS